MQKFPANPIAMFASLWKNKNLIISSIQREVLGRYKGTIMGITWPFITPLLMLIVYTFVFSVIFKARWGDLGNSKTEFSLILFSGLIIFNFFSECINRSPALILNNPNYVKKVIFPIEILPWISLGSAFFHLTISIVIWLLAYTLLVATPNPTTIYLPIVLMPAIFITIGASLTLASIGVFIRDIAQITGILTSTLLFLSPIFYPVTAIPENYRNLIYINPLTSIIENVRKILIFNEPPELKSLAASIALSLIFSFIGFALFQKTRKGFSDVL